MTLGITISLIVSTLLLFILILSLCARHFANRDVRILSNIAKKYAGTISINSFNSSATIDFSHHGNMVKLFQRKGLSNKSTRLCLCCDIDLSTPLSIHIAKGISTNTSRSEHKQFMFVPIVNVGSERFNKEFVVRGNNQSFINALLTNNFEKQILSLTTNDPILYLYSSKEPLKKIKGVKDSLHSLEFTISYSQKHKQDVEAFLENGLNLVRPFLSRKNLQ